MSRPERSGGRVTATVEAGCHAGVAPTRKNERPRLPVSDEGGVRRLSGAPHLCLRGRAERPKDAKPSVEKPEVRQSERSEVCRDRTRGKYLLPEGRACRREAVVRRDPEAEREPQRGGRERMLIARRSGAKRCTAGDCNREGGRGNTGVAAVHKAGEERRFGATPATATPPPSSQIP